MTKHKRFPSIQHLPVLERFSEMSSSCVRLGGRGLSSSSSGAYGQAAAAPRAPASPSPDSLGTSTARSSTSSASEHQSQ